MLDSINKVPKLIEQALSMGLYGLAITDHESLSGHVKALKHIDKLKEKFADDEAKLEKINNFKLVLGNEIYLVRDNLNKDNYIKGADKYFHFILLAKDKEGHKLLRKISSTAWSRSYYQFIERVPTYYSDLTEIIGNNKGHIIASTACLGSKFANLVFDAIETKSNARLDAFVDWCLDLFGEDFYIEMQPNDNEQYLYNQFAYVYAQSRGIKVTITTDTHYYVESDRKVHKGFLNAGEGDREVDDFYKTTYMMSWEEIGTYFNFLNAEQLEEIRLNTKEICDKCENYSLAHKQIIPRVPINYEEIKIGRTPFGDLYPYITKFITSEYDDDKWFINRVLNGFLNDSQVQSEADDTAHIERIEAECAEIWEVSEKIEERLSAYFTTIAKVVDIGWNEGDTLMGPWRGSAGALLTAYYLDIIQEDPLRSPVELPYWRCIHRDRPELADFDLDSQASKRQQYIGAITKYFNSIGGTVVSVCTFGTETSKAALQTSCRGLGYDSELGTYLSSLIPVDRGAVRTLTECMEGDESKGNKPVPAFVAEMYNYPDIWEVASKIEGLISRRGVHAAGIVITNNDFTELNATMKAPKGAITSQYELYDCEYLGNIKFDCLTVDALDRIRISLELLSEHGYIEWQNSLKETYNKYLKPSVLDYSSKEMWNLAAENKIINLFQFDTPVALDAVKQIQPQSLLELAQANSLLRLIPEGAEQTPVQEFSKYKQNPQLLLNEIDRLMITKEEREAILKHLKPLNGVADSQESVMLLVMDPTISNFSVAEANKLRKTIAKKQTRDIDKMTSFFFEKGKENGASEDLLKYIWNVQIRRQLGYSFSIIHTIGYSIIAIQELNLAYRFPVLFWNTACLIVDSAGIDDEDDSLELEPKTVLEEDLIEDDDDDEDEEEEVKVVKIKKKVKNVNYGKISSAIGKMLQRGINVAPPDINKSKFTFVPDVENNRILFGIKGISKINNDLANTILQNRPYESLEDFKNRVKLNKLPLINLIKSGAFDNLENIDRESILKNYIISIADQKKKLTLQNMKMVIESNLLPPELDLEKRIYEFNKYIKLGKDDTFYFLDEKASNFYTQYFDSDLLIHSENLCMITQKDWDKIYKKRMDPVREYLKNPEVLDKLNNKLFMDVYNKYANGNISKWEMESISFYYHEHELANAHIDVYDIKDFEDLPEEPIVDKIINFQGKRIPLYKLNTIIGTVIHKDKLKNIVVLSTPSGVVQLKIYKPQFVKYDKQISMRLDNGKKKVMEKSWFTRGNKLMIHGIRRDTNFVPKIYKNGIYESPINLITEIEEDGYINFISERYDVE
jgi:DNA polymerase-3 subunit alpha